MNQNFQDIKISDEELAELQGRLIEAFEPLRQAIDLVIEEISKFLEQLPEETREYIITQGNVAMQDITAIPLSQNPKLLHKQKYKSKQSRRLHGGY